MHVRLGLWCGWCNPCQCSFVSHLFRQYGLNSGRGGGQTVCHEGGVGGEVTKRGRSEEVKHSWRWKRWLLGQSSNWFLDLWCSYFNTCIHLRHKVVLNFSTPQGHCALVNTHMAQVQPGGRDERARSHVASGFLSRPQTALISWRVTADTCSCAAVRSRAERRRRTLTKTQQKKEERKPMAPYKLGRFTEEVLLISYFVVVGLHTFSVTAFLPSTSVNSETLQQLWPQFCWSPAPPQTLFWLELRDDTGKRFADRLQRLSEEPGHAAPYAPLPLPEARLPHTHTHTRTHTRHRNPSPFLVRDSGSRSAAIDDSSSRAVREQEVKNTAREENRTEFHSLI